MGEESRPDGSSPTGARGRYALTVAARKRKKPEKTGNRKGVKRYDTGQRKGIAGRPDLQEQARGGSSGRHNRKNAAELLPAAGLYQCLQGRYSRPDAGRKPTGESGTVNGYFRSCRDHGGRTSAARSLLEYGLKLDDWKPPDPLDIFGL